MRLAALFLVAGTAWCQMFPFPGPAVVQSSGGAPISVIQTAQQFTTGGGPVTFTLGSAPTLGNCLVLDWAARYFGTTDITGIVDGSAHVTWQALGKGNDGGSPRISHEVWVGSVAASANVAQTVTYGSGSNFNGRGTLYEVSGIPDCTSTGKDATFVTATGTSTAPAIGSYTTSHANDIAFVMMVDNSDSCNHLSSSPSGYTMATCQEAAGAEMTSAGYKILSSSGAQTAAWSVTLSNSWIASVIALKGN